MAEMFEDLAAIAEKQRHAVFCPCHETIGAHIAAAIVGHLPLSEIKWLAESYAVYNDLVEYDRACNAAERAEYAKERERASNILSLIIALENQAAQPTPA